MPLRIIRFDLPVLRDGVANYITVSSSMSREILIETQAFVKTTLTENSLFTFTEPISMI